MNTHSTFQKKGFTLLEILLVIAAIGILAAIVLVAINPNRQLAQARNAQRRSDVNNILNSVYQRIIDDATTGATTVLTAIPTAAGEIYRTGTTTGTNNCTGTPVNLSPLIVPLYVGSVPVDPSEGASDCSGYTIVKDANDRITVTAENTELITPDISVTR